MAAGPFWVLLLLWSPAFDLSAHINRQPLWVAVCFSMIWTHSASCVCAASVTSKPCFLFFPLNNNKNSNCTRKHLQTWNLTWSSLNSWRSLDDIEKLYCQFSHRRTFRKHFLTPKYIPLKTISSSMLICVCMWVCVCPCVNMWVCACCIFFVQNLKVQAHFSEISEFTGASFSLTRSIWSGSQREKTKL